MAPPAFAHIPLIHGADGAKLSKRHGAVSMLEFREQGFLPEAVCNYLLRLGWSHGDLEVLRTARTAIRLFDIHDVNKSASVFDVNKLTWLNQQHMMRSPAASLVPVLRWNLSRAGLSTEDDARLERIVLAQRERSKTMREMADNSAFFFRPPSAYDEKAVRKHVTPEALALLAEACLKLEALADWSAPAIHELINGGPSAEASRSANSPNPSGSRCAAARSRHRSMRPWRSWGARSRYRACARRRGFGAPSRSRARDPSALGARARAPRGSPFSAMTVQTQLERGLRWGPRWGSTSNKGPCMSIERPPCLAARRLKARAEGSAWLAGAVLETP